jgi:hypothetical protein
LAAQNQKSANNSKPANGVTADFRLAVTPPEQDGKRSVSAC